MHCKKNGSNPTTWTILLVKENGYNLCISQPKNKRLSIHMVIQTVLLCDAIYAVTSTYTSQYSNDVSWWFYVAK